MAGSPKQWILQFAFNTEPILHRTEHMQSLFCLKLLFALSVWFNHDCSFVAQYLTWHAWPFWLTRAWSRGDVYVLMWNLDFPPDRFWYWPSILSHLGNANTWKQHISKRGFPLYYQVDIGHVIFSVRPKANIRCPTIVLSNSGLLLTH